MPVQRLLPNLVLGDKKPEWNFKVDSLEEDFYNKRRKTIESAENLKKFYNDNFQEVNPSLPQHQADTIAAMKTLPGDPQSEYHRAGVEARKTLYREAAAAGYDISNDEVQSKIDILVADYHSYYYVSFAETGRLLR